MTKDEALKLALEALEIEHSPIYGTSQTAKAIKFIKEVLAQPEQEPVAFVKGCNSGQWEIFPAKAYQIFEREQPLYTTPPQRNPVAWGVFEGKLHDMFFTEAEAVEMAQLKGNHAEVKPLYTKENA